MVPTHRNTHCEPKLVRRNSRIARNRWGAELNPELEQSLSILSKQLAVSIEEGDLILLGGNWYITHSGLLRLARRNRCCGIHTETVSEFCDARLSRWAVKATVFRTPRCKGFIGYGDADPSNVSPLVRGAELRIAETRAVNRALRKAYGIGLCSVEELGVGPSTFRPSGDRNHQSGDGGNGQPRLRDRLLVLIRQHQLDAEQVKRYAACFCGTTSLREASREQVERLVNHLENLGRQGREKLLDALDGGEKVSGYVEDANPNAHDEPSADRTDIAADRANDNTQRSPAPPIVPQSPRGRSRRRINKEAA